MLDAEGRPRWRLDGVGRGDINVTWFADGTVLGSFGGIRSVAHTIVTLDGQSMLEAPATANTRGQVGSDDAMVPRRRGGR